MLVSGFIRPLHMAQCEGESSPVVRQNRPDRFWTPAGRARRAEAHGCAEQSLAFVLEAGHCPALSVLNLLGWFLSVLLRTPVLFLQVEIVAILIEPCDDKADTCTPGEESGIKRTQPAAREQHPQSIKTSPHRVLFE